MGTTPSNTKSWALLNKPSNIKLPSPPAPISAVTAAKPTDLARQVIDRGLSVRDTERLAQEAAGRTPKPPRRGAEKDADTLAIERDLSAHLKMAVRIEHQTIDGGLVTIRYRNLDQLDRLCQALGGF